MERNGKEWKGMERNEKNGKEWKEWKGMEKRFFNSLDQIFTLSSQNKSSVV